MPEYVVIATGSWADLFDFRDIVTKACDGDASQKKWSSPWWERRECTLQEAIENPVADMEARVLGRKSETQIGHRRCQGYSESVTNTDQCEYPESFSPKA